MATSNGEFLHTDPPVHHPPQILLPPWLSNSSATSIVRPQSPSITLSLSPSVAPHTSPIPWLQPERGPDSNASFTLSSLPAHVALPLHGENILVCELAECCRELDEGQRAWEAHKKETAWRFRRVELQLESEKMCRRKEKTEEFEAKVNALREEQRVALDRVEAEYREQIAGLRRDAEAREQKLADQWTSQHLRLAKFVEQMGGHRTRLPEPNGR